MNHIRTIRIGLSGLLVVPLQLVLLRPAAADVLRYHKVALTGEAAPGTPEGVYFPAFTTSLNHSIMQPRVDERGSVAFSALLAGRGVDQSNNVGIWSDSRDRLEKVVRSGEHAPGTPPDVVFIGVPSNYLPFPPAFGGGRAAFQGVLDGPEVDYRNDVGVWEGDGGGVVKVLREGDAAPGTGNGVNFYEPGVIDIDANGHVVIVSQLLGSGVEETNDEGIWSNHTGPLALLLREGDPAPVGEPNVFYGRGSFAAPGAFQRFAVNNQGLVVVQANLRDGQNVDAFSNETITLVDAPTGKVTVLVREGETAPGMGDPGITFGGNSVSLGVYSLVVNDEGELAFDIRLGGKIETTQVLYVYRDGQLRPFLLPGDQAPGTGKRFTLLGSPLINDAGDLALTASTETGFYPPVGVWAEKDRVLRKVLVPDEVVFGGMTVLGARAIGFDGAGAVLMDVTLDDPQFGYRSALVLAGPNGELHAVVMTGQRWDIGHEPREIVRIEPGGLSETGVNAFRLDFADNSSGHFTAALLTLGDLNCDGKVDFGDINPFVLALSDPGQYQVQYPDCDLMRADINNDGQVDFGDINPFVDLLSSQ